MGFVVLFGSNKHFLNKIVKFDSTIIHNIFLLKIVIVSLLEEMDKFVVSWC